MLLTFFIYLSSVINNDFIINWDDHLYVTQNDVIKTLSWETIKTIFTTFHYENYHPLTNLSNAIEYHFFELNPLPYHFINLLLHLANTLLVFIFIKKITSSKEVAIIASALFAIHPMHVESVAWVSERKDLLYTLFYLIGLNRYQNYIDGNNKIKLLIDSFLFFILSCLSKSAAVSFPIVLILLDYYHGRKFSVRILIEKIPFFLIALLFGFIALKSQSSTGATVMVTDHYSLIDRFFLCAYSLSFYILKLVFPISLSVIYLYPKHIDGLLPYIYYLSGLFILAIIFIIYKTKEMRKILVFGFLFFFATVALMIQFIPVGRAIVAERYSYLSYIGLFFIVGKIIVDVKWNKIGVNKTSLNVILILTGMFFSWITFSRTKDWKDGDALFSDLIKKDPSAIAYYNRGYVKQMAGDHKSALLDFNNAIVYDSVYALAYNNRGGAKFFLKDYKGAIEDYTKAIRYDTGNVDGYYNRAYVKQQTGDFNGAIDDYRRSLIKNPETASTVYLSMGNLKQDNKDYNGAIEEYTNCLKIDSLNFSAYFNMGNALYYLKRDSLAIINYDKAVNIKPDFADAYYNKGMASLNLNITLQACNSFRSALSYGKNEAGSMVNTYCK